MITIPLCDCFLERNRAYSTLSTSFRKNIIIDAGFVKKSPLACSRYTKNRLLMVTEIVDLALKFEKSWWHGYYAEVQSRRG